MRQTPRRVVADDGVGLQVTDIGEGPAVLLCHAWCMSSAAWDRQLRVLADAGWRAIAFDLRGHGASDKPFGDYSLPRLTADALAVLDDAGVERASLVGWSLGGLIALRLAAQQPDRVSSLVLVSSTGVSSSYTRQFPFGPPAGVIEPHQVQGLSESRVPFLRLGLGDCFAEVPDSQLLDWLHRIAMQSPSWALIATMRTLLGADQSDLLDQLAVPTTQIVGTLDPLLELAASRYLQEQLSSHLIEIDSGHYPMFECPDEFDDALLAALKDAPTR